MRGLDTEHVISGPMRGLEKKLHPMAQTDRQTDTQTDGYVQEGTFGALAPL